MAKSYPLPGPVTKNATADPSTSRWRCRIRQTRPPTYPIWRRQATCCGSAQPIGSSTGSSRAWYQYQPRYVLRWLRRSGSHARLPRLAPYQCRRSGTLCPHEAGIDYSVPVESVDHLHRTAEVWTGERLPRGVLFIVTKDRKKSLRFGGGDRLESGGLERIAAQVGVPIEGSWTDLPRWLP